METVLVKKAHVVAYNSLPEWQRIEICALLQPFQPISYVSSAGLQFCVWMKKLVENFRSTMFYKRSGKSIDIFSWFLRAPTNL